MGSTILKVLQTVTGQMGFPQPSAVVGSTDTTTQQLQEICTEVGEEMVSAVIWPELERVGTITLVADQDSYALPADFSELLPDSFWHSSDNNRVLGPLSPAMDHEWTYSALGTGFEFKWRIRGMTSTQLHIIPTPAAADAGDTLKFLYQSKHWALPRAWANNTIFATGEYCSHNGALYTATLGGTSSGTEPSDDVGVPWVADLTLYDTILADTDLVQVNNETFKLGLKSRFAEAKGLPYQKLEDRYWRNLRLQRGKVGAGPLMLTSAAVNSRRRLRGILPETGYN